MGNEEKYKLRLRAIDGREAQLRAVRDYLQFGEIPDNIHLGRFSAMVYFYSKQLGQINSTRYDRGN